MVTAPSGCTDCRRAGQPDLPVAVLIHRQNGHHVEKFLNQTPRRSPRGRSVPRRHGDVGVAQGPARMAAVASALTALEVRILALVAVSGRWEGDEASLEKLCGDVTEPDDTAGAAVAALASKDCVVAVYTQWADSPGAQLSVLTITLTGIDALRSAS